MLCTIMRRMNVAIYTRISTLVHGQSILNQTEPLTEYVKNRGFNLIQSYSDEGISGTKSSRAGLDALLKDAKRGKFKIVVVMEISRLARDVRHLLNFLHELSELGVSVISLREGIDFSGAFGKAMVAIIGALVQVERDLLSERIKTALAVKKRTAKNTGSDWRCGRPSISQAQRITALSLRAQGLSIREIAKKLAIGKSTVERILKAECPETVEITSVPKTSLKPVCGQ
jgi:putative DNA-invertase from lambdoid prophage Rac